MRVELSRFRLSSHGLLVEKGRWSRVPRDERLCVCGVVQDERHVIEECMLTEHLRNGRRVTAENVLSGSSMDDVLLMYNISKVFR